MKYKYHRKFIKLTIYLYTPILKSKKWITTPVFNYLNRKPFGSTLHPLPLLELWLRSHPYTKIYTNDRRRKKRLKSQGVLIKSIQEKPNCEALEHQLIHLVETGRWYRDWVRVPWMTESYFERLSWELKLKDFSTKFNCEQRGIHMSWYSLLNIKWKASLMIASVYVVDVMW